MLIIMELFEGETMLGFLPEDPLGVHWVARVLEGSDGCVSVVHRPFNSCLPGFHWYPFCRWLIA